MRDLWQRVAQSVTCRTLTPPTTSPRKGELVSALGEGFANSLDVAGF
jgi:hypothetical protein